MDLIIQAILMPQVTPCFQAKKKNVSSLGEAILVFLVLSVNSKQKKNILYRTNAVYSNIFYHIQFHF